MNLDHLLSNSCKNIEHKSLDIYTDEFSNYLVEESNTCYKNKKIPIIIGLHLCGTLSNRLIDLYNAIDALKILIISPCCLPTKSKKNRETFRYMTREKLKENKWELYSYWCISMYFLINQMSSVKNLVCDNLVLSPKNNFIWAVKRDFLSDQK